MSCERTSFLDNRVSRVWPSIFKNAPDPITATDSFAIVFNLVVKCEKEIQ